MPNPSKYAAYTSGELGEMLPAKVSLSYFAEHKKIDGKWSCGYSPLVRMIIGDTEVEARGKLLIYLKEQGLI